MRLSKFMLEFVPASLLLVMAFLTSASAVSRYVLNVPIPDEYEISRMLLAIVICWGLAVAFYYNDHIFLDVLWGRLSRKAKLELTRLGNLLSLGIMGFYCVALGTKVLDTMRSSLVTIDLGLSVWGFQAAAWLGTVVCVFILIARVIWPTLGAADEDGESVTAL